MKIKSTTKYHFEMVRMAIIIMLKDKKCWQGCGEKGTLVHCFWEFKLVQQLWQSVSQEFKVELPYNAATPLLGT